MSYAPVSTLDDNGIIPSHHSLNFMASSSRINNNINNIEAQQNNNNLTESLNQPHHASSTIFTSSFGRHIPEASQLEWMDDFYQGKPGIVAVFDRNGFLAGNFQFWHFIRITFILVLLAAVYYFMGVWVAKTSQNINNDEDLVILDDVQAFYFLLIAGLFVAMAYRADLQQRQQHVAITTEGIRIDQGMAMTIIIPFETIHSCEAHMTTKYLCGYMERSDLTQVQVVRSLAPMEQIGFRKTRSFVIYGLVRPQEFVALVQAFKNSQQHGTYEGGTELTSSSYGQMNNISSSTSPQSQHQQVGLPAGQNQQMHALQFSSPQQTTTTTTSTMMTMQPPPPPQQQQQQHSLNPYSQQVQIVASDDSEVVASI